MSKKCDFLYPIISSTYGGGCFGEVWELKNLMPFIYLILDKKTPVNFTEFLKN